MPQPEANRGRIATICVLLAATTLGGCVDTAVELGARRSPTAQRQRPVARPGVSPRGAAIALASLEGAPEEALARFRPLLERTAESRDIALTGETEAAYKLRGYLTAYAGPEGMARVAYVFDVFDRSGHRTQRLTDETPVRGTADAWSAVGDKELAELAAHGADDLAAFLSNTPEALAAAGGESGVTIATATRPAPAQTGAPPLGFAAAR